MKIFTPSQKEFILRKNIKVGNSYMFPRFGFRFYETPDYLKGEFMDSNPFTKSLDSESFEVKEITENGFVKGNFAYKPKGRDFYLLKSELEQRGLIEILALTVLLFIPLSIYNMFKNPAHTVKTK